ncbi:MAG: arylamine N-acetyltransferase [Woeseiaceae bacterium]|nr:arylamine N-acetyltransferase [Woeseiaceae bacterium]
MELAPYLDRIAYDEVPRPDLDTLRNLQRAHVLAVPFENLDVQLGHRLTLDVAAAYDKIVRRGRGGWCYEQNGLFGWALGEIGFDVMRVAGSVMRAERGVQADANHLCLLVRCEDSGTVWLADVGFGGSLLEPIELAEYAGRQQPFAIGLRRLDAGEWQFWENLGDGDFSYDFAAAPADETAMAARCDFLQSDPGSNFVLNLVVQRRAADSHLSLRGRVLREAGPDGIRTRTLGSAAELTTVLAERFRLDVPESATLWPRILARHEALALDAD